MSAAETLQLQAMLNIAGGVIIGGAVLGLFGGGLKLLGGSDFIATATGTAMILIAGFIAFWLIWGRLAGL